LEEYDERYTLDGKTAEEDPHYLPTLRQGFLPCEPQGLFFLWFREIEATPRIPLGKQKA
jgi:hypothetical protein